MKKFLSTSFSALLLLGSIGSASAVPLSDLVAGQTLQVDDKLFADWSFEVVFDTGGANPDPSLIEVSPISAAGDANPFEPGPGIEIFGNGQIATTGWEQLNVVIGFSVEALDPIHPIKDNLLEITGVTFDPINFGGIVDIYEFVYDGPPGSGGNLIGQKYVVEDNSGFLDDILSDTAEFDPISKIYVEKDILVSGDDIFDFVSLDSVVQRFSQVPEPATLLLFGVGAAGIGFARRRRTA